MALIVQKYGGTSVGTVERIQKVAANIARFRSQGHQLIVAVSAQAGTTDNLIKLAQQVDENASPRELDMLLATGEQISIALLAMALNKMGIPAVSLTGQQAGILTDGVHTKARILEVEHERINRELSAGKVIIIAGFQGVSADNNITTLGRGGSDTTAVAIAASLQADLCEIYTDVDGIYTADPRIVEHPHKLKTISYEEMLELASLGAKVLHPRSVEVAKIHNVCLSVRSSFETEKEGTYVVNKECIEKTLVVTGIASDKNTAKIGIFDVPDTPGNAAKIFDTLGRHNLNVDMIIQSSTRDSSVNDISFTIPKSDLAAARDVLENLRSEVGFGEVVYSDDVAKISAVGAGMVSVPGVAAKVFTTLYQENINIEMISTSEIKISCIIKNYDDNVARAVRSLHAAFELDKIEQ